MKELSVNRRNKILETLKLEESKVIKALEGDAEDVEELKSEWQERDSASENNLRTVEWNQYSSLQDALTEIVDAKQRLEEGIYGICEDCDESISPKRLVAVPTARKCLECQVRNERVLGIAEKRASL